MAKRIVSMPEPVVVIGVGVDGLDGLSPQARACIERADQVWAGERWLALLPECAALKVKLGKDVFATLRQLAQRLEDTRIVLLASGDPGFFGVGGSVLNLLPPEQVTLLPQASLLQSAFARARLSWSDAHLTSAHARPIAELLGYARRYRKVGILTDPHNTPSRIAECLLAAGIQDCRAIVFENLGLPYERMTDTRLSGLAGQTFAELNVLLVVQDETWRPQPCAAPRPDGAYAHRNGLITKADVRVLSLSRLRLGETDVIWDIGAGSGAVSIEMAELAWRGNVFAIEKDAACLAFLRQNLARYGVLNVTVVAAEAPQALAGLPRPDAIFIGGTGGNLEPILSHIEQAAPDSCRVVANFTLLENLLQAYHWMERRGWEPALTELQLSYGATIAGGMRLAPANPVFILNGVARAAARPGKE
jgi:precorrin-6Y C5,15-methyltransferase (decarboxylating)